MSETSEMYWIRYSDPNPECVDSKGKKRVFWVPETTDKEKATRFDTPESAQVECDRLQGSTEVRKCPSCGGMFRNTDRKFFVEKIPAEPSTDVWAVEL